MPVRSRAGGGAATAKDPLDVALAAPGPHQTVPGQKGFFGALKPNSPLFPQTSRVNVDRPAAQIRQQARIVPPPPAAPVVPTRAQNEAKLAANMPHASSVTGLARGAAHVAEAVGTEVAHHPLRAALMATPGPLSLLANPLAGKGAHAANAEAQKGVAAVGRASAGPDLSGAASTNAGILDAYQKMGTPYAALAPSLQQKVRDAVAFFATKPEYKYPSIPNLGLYSPEKKQALGLPPTATDADVYRKAYEPWTGHRNFLETTLHNVPLDLAQNVAAPLGLYDVLTHPTTLGPEFARQQFDFGKSLIPGVGHPLSTLEHQPVSTLTAALALTRGAGGAGGTFARSRFNPSEGLRSFGTPAPREVVPAGFRAQTQEGESLVPPVNRGMSSPKLDVRLAQAASDAFARHVPGFGDSLPGRALDKILPTGQHIDRVRADEITKESNRFVHQLERDQVEPAARASAKLNRHDRRANTAFIGQGYHSMEEAAAHTKLQADTHRAQEQTALDEGTHVTWETKQRSLDQKAEIAAKLATGRHAVDVNDPKFQKALRANTVASRSGEQQMIEQGVGQPDTFLRRAYGPRAKIEADLHGDPNAQRVLDLAHQSNDLSDKLKLAQARLPRAEALRRELDQLRRVASDQERAARPERGTSERLAQQRANLFSGQHEEPLTPDLYGADNPVSSPRAQERADMRKGVETRTRQRAARPLDARIERAQARLNKVTTPHEIERRIAGTHDEQMGLVDEIRQRFRAERGAPPVAKGAPLDAHDPLWMQHAIESPKTFFGLRRGTTLTGTNPNAKGAYSVARTGKPGHQATMGLSDESSSDPSIFFKGLGKPHKVTAKLRHLENQVKGSIQAPPPGSRYDTRRFVLVDTTKRGQGVLGAQTTEDATQAIHDLGDHSIRAQILDRFKEPQQVTDGHMATVPDDGGEYYLMTKNARANVEGTVRSFNSPALKFLKDSTNFWRWMTLTARPAWLVNNFGGTAIQTAMEGVGLRSLYRATQTGTGGKLEGIIPPQVNNGGFMGGSFERPEGVRSGLMRPVDRISQGIVNLNTKAENWGRRAVAVQESLNIAKAKLHGEERTIANNLHRTTQEVIDLARERTPENDAQIMGRVNHALGDFLGKGDSHPAIGVASPFYRWFKFITKLTVEMPVRTPGRALVLQRLGQFGINVQQQQTGGFTPNSWLGQIRVPDWVPHYGGEYKSTQALFPYATLAQLAAMTGQDTHDPGQISYTGMLGALNPAVNVGLETLTGLNPTFNFSQLKDSSGNWVGPLNPGVFAHAAESSFPITNLALGYRTGDASYNPLAPQDKTPGAYAQPSQDFADRLAGYFLGGVAHRDFQKNWLASWKRFQTEENAYANKRALAGHGPKAK